jgi:murein L,D-transpeptidase YafK
MTKICTYILLLWCGSALAAPPVATTLSHSGESRGGELAAPGVPAGLIYEDRSNPYLIWVALDEHQLYLLERDGDGRYLAKTSRPISIGRNGSGKQVEGDLKTPIGVYQITTHFRDAELDDFYGLGAFPVNFPNVWDRIRKRTGHGIWLHGMPKGIDNRPPLDSEGCVVVDNDTIVAMEDFIETGESLFVLSSSLTWLPPGTQQPDADILEAIEHWRTAWEVNDVDDYLANYHPEFTDTNRNLAAWSEYKRRVNGRKKYIRVKLSEMSVIEYPGEENLVAVRFYQNYESNNHRWQGWKHLLWRRDDAGEWRILYEGNG